MPNFIPIDHTTWQQEDIEVYDKQIQKQFSPLKLLGILESYCEKIPRNILNRCRFVNQPHHQTQKRNLL